MGKDREGRFHPAKGKPSNDTKERLGLRSTMNADDLKQDEEMTEKYTESDDKLAPGVRMKHPNRNTIKDEDYKKEKNKWTCVSCTYINNPPRSHCEICDMKNIQRLDMWSCPKCTYQNKAERLYCEMCGGPEKEKPLSTQDNNNNNNNIIEIII